MPILNCKSDMNLPRSITSAFYGEQISLGTLYIGGKYSCLGSALQHRMMISSK